LFGVDLNAEDVLKTISLDVGTPSILMRHGLFEDNPVQMQVLALLKPPNPEKMQLFQRLGRLNYANMLVLRVSSAFMQQACHNASFRGSKPQSPANMHILGAKFFGELSLPNKAKAGLLTSKGYGSSSRVGNFCFHAPELV
jgi:hypothetical protein